MALNYTITHNGSTWESTTALDSIPISNGSVTDSITTAGTRTLNCAGKVASNNIVIGAKTLNCAGKIMAGNIVITALKPLNEYTWAEISAISTAGTGANYWSVGDYKEVTLKGNTVGSLVMSGTYRVYILGFDHNSSIEGTGIHFCLGRDSTGLEITFIDSGYLSAKRSGSWFNIQNNDNYQGWENSSMRTVIMLSVFDNLPDDLQAVIKTVTKKSWYYSEGSIQTTTDKCFLMSQYEVFAGLQYESSVCQRYAYYTNGASKLRYRHSKTSSTAYWWLRSCAMMKTGYMYGVTDAGKSYEIAGVISLGLVPCFVV